jgi:quinol monooxygenase YgiN
MNAAALAVNRSIREHGTQRHVIDRMPLREFEAGQDGQVLMIDHWKSVEAFQTFAGSPEIQVFFATAFEQPPEVVVWTKSNWMEW